MLGRETAQLTSRRPMFLLVREHPLARALLALVVHALIAATRVPNRQDRERKSPRPECLHMI